MEKIKTNILIIGKSGVGKSSLLNYLFGEEIQQTGVGRPVTKKGIFPFEYPYDEKFDICIYDTWGLEPDKTGDWEKLICDEVASHDKKHISEWFSTIIFCFSAKSSRVEDFEIGIIKKLLNENNQMLITITHCDSKNDNGAETMKKTIVSRTGIKENQIVLVNNVDVKLISKSVERFGRQEVFVVIINNLWNSLKEKVPSHIDKQVKLSFQIAKEKFEEDISKKVFVFRKKRILEEFEKKIKEEFGYFLSSELEYINSQFSDAIDYYNNLSTKYAEISLMPKDELLNMSQLQHCTVLDDFEKKVGELVDVMINGTSKLIILLKADLSKKVVKDLIVTIGEQFTRARGIKKSLKANVNKYANENEYIMCQHIKKIAEDLQKINVESIGMQMIQNR